MIKKNALPIVILIIGVSLLLLAVSKNKPASSFEITAQEMLTKLDGFEHVTGSQAREMQNDTDQYVFVDLRSPYDFEVKHIAHAINIPTAFVLDKENMDLFKEYLSADKTVVLYSQTERESISPWMLLYELGFTNTKVLMGGFDCFVEETEDCPTTMSRYDYAKIAAQGGIKEVEVIKKKPVAKKKKAIPVQKKVKVEDEGGC
jgi:rhodanese-related sulfurtransferase